MFTHMIGGTTLHYPATELISGSHSSNHKVWWCEAQQNCYSLLFFSVGKQRRKNRAGSLSTHDKRSGADDERTII